MNEDYTVNEAREIISKYFDKISVEHKKDDVAFELLTNAEEKNAKK